MRQSPDNATVLETAAATAQSVAAEMATTLDGARELARAAGRLADQRVREQPWQTAMIAGAVGFLIGLCVTRR